MPDFTAGDKDRMIPGQGFCFKNALTDAGIAIPPGLNIGEWIDFEQIKEICDALNLKWHGNGHLSLDIEPVIVLYQTRPGFSHAVYMRDIGPLLEDNPTITGIIQLSHDEGERQ